ncbi:MAG: 1-deoxy-D-xylulose-5-phosphate reductoisomerase [Deltaproteobacteria bacterium]
MKNISVLGSTGSIGRQTLEVISMFPEKFRVSGLAAGKNSALLKEQILKFKPVVVSVQDEGYARALSSELRGLRVEVLCGESGAEAVASESGADVVVSAMVGAAGLKPTIAAARAGRNIALANKEALVMAGAILIDEAARRKIDILPVDSEHSAILQALGANGRECVKRLILTASGGPFLRTSADRLENVSIEAALNHPTWKMGKKITIDSATLMNKGFEVIEAKWLFGTDARNISVWIHPQSIVHSMVEFHDGSIIAQMGLPDMRIPISYAMSYPDRMPMNRNRASAADFGGLTFEDADVGQFPALSLAYSALEEGGTMPAAMNGANEAAVSAFLEGRIGFTQIIATVARVMDKHIPLAGSELSHVLEADLWARRAAEAVIDGRGI